MTTSMTTGATALSTVLTSWAHGIAMTTSLGSMDGWPDAVLTIREGRSAWSASAVMVVPPAAAPAGSAQPKPAAALPAAFGTHLSIAPVSTAHRLPPVR